MVAVAGASQLLLAVHHLGHRRFSLENLGYIWVNPLRNKDNVRLKFTPEAIKELEQYRHAGGRTVVDVTHESARVDLASDRWDAPRRVYDSLRSTPQRCSDAGRDREPEIPRQDRTPQRPVRASLRSRVSRVPMGSYERGSQ